jgi:hypothetical protein
MPEPITDCVTRDQLYADYVTDISKEETTMLSKYGKKILSLALASATVASLAAPAFAADNSTVITAAYEEISIDVTVSPTGTATINPYGLPIKFTKSDGSTKTAAVEGEAIVTTPLSIKNNSESKLKVSATVTTVNGKNSGIEFVSAAPASTVTSKQAFVQLQLKKSAKTGTAGNTLEDLLADEFVTAATWTTPDGAVTLSTDDPVTGKDLVTLEKYDSNNGYVANSIALFRLGGKVVEDPDEAWTTKDTFTTTIAFTFKPDTSSGSNSNQP